MKRFLFCLFLGVSLYGCGGSGDGIFDNPDDPPVTGDNYARLMDLTYWPSRPVAVAFETSGTYTPQREEIAITAFQEWYEATDGLVTFTKVALDESPNIVVRFKPSADDSEENVAGVTTLMIQGDRILEATIDIGTNLDAQDFVRTAIHEFGHAYGLTGGHSDRRSDIMYAYLTSTNDVSDRDANTMRIAYTGSRNIEINAPIRMVKITTGENGCSHKVVGP